MAKEPVAAPVFTREIEIGIEYCEPLEEDRHIETISVNVLVPIHQKTGSKSLEFYKGITLTRPWGSIHCKEIDPDSSAFGVGPVYCARKQWTLGDKWQIVTDFSGGLIIYSDNFPAGGDIYNFMWRLGPKLVYRVSDGLDWIVGYELMHVSNGQLSNTTPSHNPSYNAGGFTISMNRRF